MAPAATAADLTSLLSQLGAATPTGTTTPLTTTPVSAANPLQSLLGSLAGVSPATAMPTTANVPQQVFTNPIADLAALNPFASLAASNPAAALAAVSPALNIFNPAVNPNAALLAFNPAAANTLALSGLQGQATLPFGKGANPFSKGANPFSKGFGKGMGFPFFGI
jgi:hypothetical protein